MEILLKQLSEPAPPPSQLCPDLPPSVDRALAWMMAKEAAKRPPNLVTAVKALEEGAVEVGVAVPASPQTGLHAQQTTPAILAARTPDWAAAGVPATAAMKAAPVRTPAPGASAQVVAQLGSAATMTPDQLPPGQSFIAAESAERPVVRRSNRVILFGSLAVVVAAAAVAVVIIVNKKGGPKAAAGDAPIAVNDPQGPQAQPPAPPVITPPATAADAGPVEAAAPTVTIDIEGPPAGTKIRIGTLQVGTAPGPVVLPRGSTAVKLVFEASGYKRHEEEITPDKDYGLRVKLERKRTGIKRPDKDDIEDPFAP
jgi:serine/threonine-protein kinase